MENDGSFHAMILTEETNLSSFAVFVLNKQINKHTPKPPQPRPPRKKTAKKPLTEPLKPSQICKSYFRKCSSEK